MSEIKATLLTDQQIATTTTIINIEDILSSLRPSQPGSSTGDYIAYTFSGSALTIANLLVYQHNFNKVAGYVRILDPTGERVEPDETDNGLNAIVLDFTYFVPLKPGNWTLIVGT